MNPVLEKPRTLRACEMVHLGLGLFASRSINTPPGGSGEMGEGIEWYPPRFVQWRGVSMVLSNTCTMGEGIKWYPPRFVQRERVLNGTQQNMFNGRGYSMVPTNTCSVERGMSGTPQHLCIIFNIYTCSKCTYTQLYILCAY